MGQQVAGRQDLAPAEGEAVTRLVAGFTIVPALIRQFGIDPVPVLAEAGLEPGALDDPSNRIPHAGAMRLLNQAAKRTGSPHFGLLFGRTWHLSETGVVGALMRDSPTVGEALHELVVNQHLNSQGPWRFCSSAAASPISATPCTSPRPRARSSATTRRSPSP